MYLGRKTGFDIALGAPQEKGRQLRMHGGDLVCGHHRAVLLLKFLGASDIHSRNTATSHDVKVDGMMKCSRFHSSRREFCKQLGLTIPEIAKKKKEEEE